MSNEIGLIKFVFTHQISAKQLFMTLKQSLQTSEVVRPFKHLRFEYKATWMVQRQTIRGIVERFAQLFASSRCPTKHQALCTWEQQFDEATFVNWEKQKTFV
uniref:Uncharacterized protein n=1 Tax=Onchocerca volvulus TaxID=6282 RepID=A0A8R1TQM0_ONCVO